ncbi:MAG: GH3 auxin-responsive promoter family protein [Anaerolineae bacterium]|nr:GH3 auxin-responsive promoter family protein [Anaerolineae bacterium]
MEKEATWYSPLFRQMTIWIGQMMLQQLHAQSRHAQDVQRKTLREILKRARNSEFGSAHHFEQILKESDVEAAYKATIPLSCYEDYSPYIEHIKQGRENVLFSDPLTGLAFTSGSTGHSKLVPVTRRHQGFAMRCGSFLTYASADKYIPGSRPWRKGICLMSYAGTPEHTEAGVPMGMASALGIRRIVGIIPHLWCSPTPVFLLEDDQSAWYLHALYGLRNPEVQYIVATFTPHLLRWLTALEERWAELVNDIEKGTLTADLTLPAGLRESLTRDLYPDPSRAAALREAAASGFGNIIRRIWPRIAYINVIATGSFAVYVPMVRAYTGDLPLYSSFYSASEATIGMALWPDHAEEYALMPQAAYFEFIQLEEEDAITPKIVGIGELKPDSQYELVLTNHAGLYRYRLGDIIKMARYHNELPVFRFDHRRSTILNLAGEKMTEAHTRYALEQWGRTWLQVPADHIYDYTTASNASVSPPRYTFYIEMTDKIIPDDALATLNAGAQHLDEALKMVNHYYEHNRRHSLVSIPQIKLVSSGSFDLLYEQLLTRSPGINHTQLKIPRLLADPQLLELMESRVVAVSS